MHTQFKSINFILLVTLIILGNTAHGKEENVDYGTYACIAQRTVGLQGDRESGQRTHGKIILPAEQDHFLVTISRIEDNDRTWCKNSKVGNRLVTNEYRFWWYCRTKNQLSFSKDKYPLNFRSDEMNIFRSELDPVFHITNDGRYIFYSTNLEGDFYLEEGVCQRK